MKTSTRAASLLLIALLTAPATAFDFQTVMASGRPDGDSLGPQLGPGVDFSSPGKFSVNSSGQVAFSADLIGPGIVSTEGGENDTAMWRWTSSAKELLLREDAQAPGLPNGVLVNSIFAAFANGAELADDGSAMSFVQLKGAGVSEDLNDQAFLRLDGPGTGLKVFRSGDLVPSTFLSMTRDLASFSMPTRDSTGHVMFRVNPLAGPGVTSLSNDALVFGMDNNYSLLVREGQQPAGFASNFVYREFPQAQMAFSGDRFVFGAAVHDNNDPDADAVIPAFFAGTVGSIELIAADGDPLPDASGNYFHFGSSRINAAGTILFDANNSYLAGTKAGGFQFIAKQGQLAPGTSETFGILGGGNNGPTLSQLTATGLVAFEGTLSGPGDRNQGIWIHDGSSLELAIRAGDAAGSLPGVTLGALEEWAFNDLGNLVVKSALVGPSVTTNNDFGLWLVDASGQMSLLLREGDLFDVDPGIGVDERIISGLTIGGRDSVFNNDSRTNGLTDNNWITLELQFNDGTNAIVVSNLTVPEPTSIMSLGLGSVLVFAVRRRCRCAVIHS
jgi:hypothetical protein